MRSLTGLFLALLIANPLWAQGDYADDDYSYDDPYDDSYDSYDDEEYYDDLDFQDVMGDDYYELSGNASNADRLQYARIVTRNLLGFIGNSYNSEKRALDQRWADGEIDSPQREALLSTLNETTEAMRNQVRGSGYEDMVLEELLVFARETMATSKSSIESYDDYDDGYDDDSAAQSPLADALESCSSYSEEFEHELTGDWLTRSIEPAANGCRYRETIPGNFQMTCLWSETEQLTEIADYFRNVEYYADADMSSKTEYVDGQPVTRTTYTLDGEPWRHPIQESVESGQCKVARQ